MPNPILPLWEHIPDGEPRLYGDRVYLYGSHDTPGSDSFCDSRLKTWSAPVNDLNQWVCHGDIFLSQPHDGREADVTWMEGARLYAPDAIEIKGKYYLFVYVFYGRGCVAVSDTPEGPYRVMGAYTWGDSETFPKDVCDNGVLVDPGVLLDDDGKLYIFGGFERSWGARLNPDKPWQVLPDTYVPDILPAGEPFRFFEAASPRKIGNTYYLVYSPRRGSCLAYATSDSPLGPYTYRGVIIDNGVDYPGGNDHGGLCRVGNQWYIFYHRMTNDTLYSRQACAEKIRVLPDGSIPQVEMTSLGFDESLNPYAPTPAHWACVLKGGRIQYVDPLHTLVGQLKNGSVVGYKYFDFGQGKSETPQTLHVEARGTGENGTLTARLDDPEAGEVLAKIPFGPGDALLSAPVRPVTGRHALYFTVSDGRRQGEWGFSGRELIRLERFVFTR